MNLGMIVLIAVAVIVACLAALCVVAYKVEVKRRAAIKQRQLEQREQRRQQMQADRQRREQREKERLDLKLQAAQEWLASLKVETSPVVQYQMLANDHDPHYSGTYYVDHYLPDADSQWCKERLKILAEGRAQHLLEEARSGSRHAFAELNTFTSPNGYNSYQSQTNGNYETPADWNDIVVQLFENPSLYDFRFVNRDAAPNSTRLMAAEALRTKSIVTAKMVLAFCAKRKHREEIGTMAEDLAKFVDAYHVEHGMFQASTITT